VFGERRVTVTPEMNARDLHQALSEKACELLHIELMDYLRGNLAGVPQDPSGVTLAAKIPKDEAWIDWRKSAWEIHNHVRGLVLGPVAATVFGGQRLRILRTAPPAQTENVSNSVNDKCEETFSSQQQNHQTVEALPLPFADCLAPGTMAQLKSRLFVSCGSALNGFASEWIEVLELQPESKKAMQAAEFIRGYPAAENSVLAFKLEVPQS